MKSTTIREDLEILRINSAKIMDKDIEGALDKGICIDCGQPALPNCYSEAGREEYMISGLCEKCFDATCCDRDLNIY